MKQVGRELGVRYVLEGSLRKSGSRIRVTAQLVEAETGRHVWAERYDRELAEVFAVQDEITEAVTTTVTPVIADAEQHRALRRPPGRLDAWGAYQRGLWHLSKVTAEDNALAEKFFQRAIDLDPIFTGGYTGLAAALDRAGNIFRTRDLADAQSAEEALALRAVALDGGDAEARARLAIALSVRGDRQGARAEAERALTISPNLAEAHGALGVVLTFGGHPREGLTALKRCIQLDPRSPFLVLRLRQVAFALYFCREYAASAEAARQAIRSYPDRGPYAVFAAALGQMGCPAEAKQALERLPPGVLDAFVRGGALMVRPEDHAHLIEGLRKAGFPVE